MTPTGWFPAAAASAIGPARRRPRAAASATVAAGLLLAIGLLAACGGGATPQRQLSSVMVGSDTVLDPDEADRVDAIGLELSALGVPLRRWWELRRDLEPGDAWRAQWERRSAALLDQLRDGVARLEQRLSADAHPAVLETFWPYVHRWEDLVRALEAQRSAVLAGDDAAEEQALAAYDRAVQAIDRLDAARVQRVVAVYGEQEATRLLRDQGIDPRRFGLGSGGGGSEAARVPRAGSLRARG